MEAEWIVLEISTDSEDSVENDPDYVPSTEDTDECSSDCSSCEKCYYCQADLDYEDNEFYDEEADRFYCERCWNDILEN